MYGGITTCTCKTVAALPRLLPLHGLCLFCGIQFCLKWAPTLIRHKSKMHLPNHMTQLTRQTDTHTSSWNQWWASKNNFRFSPPLLFLPLILSLLLLPPSLSSSPSSFSTSPSPCSFSFPSSSSSPSSSPSSSSSHSSSSSSPPHHQCSASSSTWRVLCSDGTQTTPPVHCLACKGLLLAGQRMTVLLEYNWAREGGESEGGWVGVMIGREERREGGRESSRHGWQMSHDYIQGLYGLIRDPKRISPQHTLQQCQVDLGYIFHWHLWVRWVNQSRYMYIQMYIHTQCIHFTYMYVCIHMYCKLWLLSAPHC